MTMVLVAGKISRDAGINRKFIGTKRWETGAANLAKKLIG